VTVAFRADIAGVAAIVLLDAIAIRCGICADSAQAFKLACHNRDVNGARHFGTS